VNSSTKGKVGISWYSHSNAVTSSRLPGLSIARHSEPETVELFRVGIVSGIGVHREPGDADRHSMWHMKAVRKGISTRRHHLSPLRICIVGPEGGWYEPFGKGCHFLPCTASVSLSGSWTFLSAGKGFSLSNERSRRSPPRC
jgi:hypothetical protein